MTKAGYNCPEFAGVLDCPVDNSGKFRPDLLDIQVLGPQFNSFVKNFMINRFPQLTMKNWVTDPTDNISHQDGIKEHLNDLQATTTFIMHPKTIRHWGDGTYIFENRPHYTTKLLKLKSRLKKGTSRSKPIFATLTPDSLGGVTKT